MQLSFNLVYANRFLPEVLRDERLKPMLENMSKAYTGPDYGSARKVSRTHDRGVITQVLLYWGRVCLGLHSHTYIQCTVNAWTKSHVVPNVELAVH